MNKTVRYILYAVIVAICIIALFVGVYGVIFKDASKTNITTGNEDNETANQVQTAEEVKNGFKDLFTNEFFKSNFDDSKVQKADPDKEIVYDAVTSTDKKANYYELNVHIPFININSDLANQYNEYTQSQFVQYANNLVSKETPGDYTIYNVSFTSYINNDVLSVAILAEIKVGNEQQRTMVKTYNYNLTTNKEVTISEILDNRGIDSTVVNKKINSTVQEAKEQEEAMIDSGYNEIYQRDLQSDIYDVKRVTDFFQGPNGELYIIYAYGNTSDIATSEMDVVVI
jgi:hypothetical protein